ncbi:MAG: phenylacetate--CoA ligase family protein [Desulfosarcina sp.]|nr:phenylacetate--CoA ligase family protein [Desulfobacterales bacterium]
MKNRKLSKLFFLLPVEYLSIFEAPDILFGKLMEIKPHNVYGPPSCLFVVAKKAMQAGVRVPNLVRIFTSSEYLADPVKRYIEKSLGARVHDVYGSTETKEMAWQCPLGDGYHINEDEVIIEIVDEEGKVLPPASPGHIVITDLRNQAMPLIRYRNHDKGLLINEACACGLGFALMKPLTGRASEYIRLPDGREISPFLFTTSIEKTKGLLQYQIIQEQIDTIRVKTIFKEGLFDQGRTAIQSILSDLTGNTMTMVLEDCDRIELEKNGKLMVVKNEIMVNRSPVNEP